MGWPSSRRTPSLVVVCVVVLVLMLGLSLSGCTGGDDEPSGTPSSIEPGVPLETLADDGLPADFPRQQIPLIEGDVVSVDHGDGWTVAVLSDAAPTAAVDDAVTQLEAAGWEDQTAQAGVPPAVQVLTQGSGQAIVTNEQSEEQTLITYAVDLP